jgi:hypothetical protein
LAKAASRHGPAIGKTMNNQLAKLLQPIDPMLTTSPFLLADCPLFADFNLL